MTASLKALPVQLLAAPPDSQKADADDKALMKACLDFEAMFTKELLIAANLGPSDDGLFATDTATGIFWGMYRGQLAEDLTHGQSLGLAKIMYDDVKRKADLEAGAAKGATQEEASDNP